MLRRLVAFLLGHLRIEVSRGQIERFLNLALAHDLTLWNIQRTPDVMRASLTIRDFFALRPVARGARCRVHIIGRQGLPFLLVSLRRRPMLIAGAAGCVAILIWATGHVWFIDPRITGPHNLDTRAVAAVAAEAGLKFGASKGSIDTHKVEQLIQERLGETVSWAIVRMQGTRAIIEVVEKVAVRKQGEVGCVNLVARKAGVIEEVVPFQGEPKVKKGDIVMPGQLLVECAFKYWSGGRPAVLPGTEKPPREATARTLVAQAIVRARVTYTKYQEIPLYQTVEVPTGREATTWVLKWNDQPIILRGNAQSPFMKYQESRKTYALPQWRNWKSPVELVILSTREVEAKREPIPVDMAISQAKAKAEELLRWQLGAADKVTKPMTAEVLTQGQEFIGVRTTVETLEEIAQPVAGQPLPAPAPAEPGANPVHP